MSTLTKEEVTIEKLLPEIKANYREFKKSGQETVNYARQLGDLLWKLKECVKHGEFGPLIEKRCDFSHRAAATYMKLSAGWNLIGVKEAGPDATIGGYLKAIGQARPKGGQKEHKRNSPKAADTQPSPQEKSSPRTEVSSEPQGELKISGGTKFDPAELTSESKDAFGAEAPDDLRQVFEICEEFDAQRSKIAGIKSWITQRVNHPGGAVLESAAQRIKSDLDQADSELKFSKPYCVCVYCENKEPKVFKCSACKGAGWMTEPLYKAAPKGLKREKAQA